MRGDELVSILGSYMSGLEQVILQGVGESSDRSPSPWTDWDRQAIGTIEVGKNGEVLDQLFTRTASDVRNRQIDNGPGWFQSTSGIGAISGLIGQRVDQRLEGVGSLADADSMTGRMFSSMANGLASSTVAALLNVFRGSETNNQWREYERPRYTWEGPSNLVEGIAGGSSRVTTTDLQYDGLPRADETRLTGSNRIDVRIEALDARSFLDRKEEIAEAVRQAMLTSGVLGPALSEY